MRLTQLSIREEASARAVPINQSHGLQHLDRHQALGPQRSENSRKLSRSGHWRERIWIKVPPSTEAFQDSCAGGGDVTRHNEWLAGECVFGKVDGGASIVECFGPRNGKASRLTIADCDNSNSFDLRTSYPPDHFFRGSGERPIPSAHSTLSSLFSLKFFSFHISLTPPQV